MSRILLGCLLYLSLASPRLVHAVSGEHLYGSAPSVGSLLNIGFAAQLLAGELDVDSFEHRLGVGTKFLLRDVRWFVRHLVHIPVYAILQWATWAKQGLAFVLLVLVWPLLDRGLLQIWRQRGFAGVRASVALMLAVYLRLLLDPRTPGAGKALLLFAVVYGAAPSDLVPDSLGMFAFADDCVVVAVAYRYFMFLCPQRLVEEHAIRAGRAREWNLRRRGGRPVIHPDAGDTVGS